MEDVTLLMQTYRECVRHIWNTYFRTVEDGDIVFPDVEDALFSAMVMPQACVHDTIPRLHVVPSATPIGVPALWARMGGSIVEWKEIRLSESNIELHFNGYFDWDDQGYRDYQYYETYIAAYPAAPELEGANLLIEVSLANVFLVDLVQPQE